MKYQFIYKHQDQFRLNFICNIFSISRSSYYNWLCSKPGKWVLENAVLLKEIKILHYANMEAYQDIKKEAGKPVGVGECTIAYFGTPKHAAKFAGDLAYNSVEDRMKGVAIETYGQLKAQLEANFSYLSVFNLAWYGLKPLPLGHRHQENSHEKI